MARDPAARPIDVGTRVGNYEITERIGAGGFAVVYRVEDLSTGEEYALKVPNYAGANPERIVDKYFTRERAALEAIGDAGGHPNIMELYEDVVYDRKLLLVIELIEGRELEEIEPSPGQFSPGEVREVGIDLADAMSFLHENMIVYRDLKPDNIILDRTNTAHLIDFSTAKQVDRWTTPPQPGKRGRSDTDGDDSIVRGGMEFKPPEVLGEKDLPQGPWSDVYSIGKILFFAFTGAKLESSGLSPGDVAYDIDVPPYFDAIVERATREHPTERYGSATELKRALEHRDPEPPIHAELTHLPTGRTYAVEGGATIGREGAGPPTEIELDNAHVSKVHCRFVIQGQDEWVLVDQSLNGTYVHLQDDRWKQLLSEDGRRRLKANNVDPDDFGGDDWEVLDANDDTHRLSDGDTIALVSPDYGDETWFIFNTP